MKYMCLIYSPEMEMPGTGSPELEESINGYFALSQDSYKAGVLVRGDELASASTATTLRVRDGETVLSDGPFIETKEQLGGYYIFDVPNLDDAIKWAEKIPGARRGTIEIRPIVDHEG
jgi:hypothetical protein